MKTTYLSEYAARWKGKPWNSAPRKARQRRRTIGTWSTAFGRWHLYRRKYHSVTRQSLLRALYVFDIHFLSASARVLKTPSTILNSSAGLTSTLLSPQSSVERRHPIKHITLTSNTTSKMTRSIFALCCCLLLVVSVLAAPLPDDSLER